MLYIGDPWALFAHYEHWWPWVILVFLFASGQFYLYLQNSRELINSTVVVILLSGTQSLQIFKNITNLPWFFPLLAVLTILTYVTALLYKLSKEKRNNFLFQKILHRYLSPDMIKQVTSKPNILKLGGEQRTMTVVFSDVRGFTALSETYTPYELSVQLNHYLNEMTDIILDHNGTIDKFIGDAIMAFWNGIYDDPDHQKKAIQCALAMSKRLSELKQQYKSYHEFGIGVGVNTGSMLIGNIGGDRRFDYTVLGDNVNLASRLESLTKAYGVEILVAETALQEVQLPKSIITRQIDEIIVKGKSFPVKVYQPMTNNKTNASLKEIYEQAFSQYQKGYFESAKMLFKMIKGDPSAKLMLERIQHEEIDLNQWTGVWKWQTK